MYWMQLNECDTRFSIPNYEKCLILRQEYWKYCFIGRINENPSTSNQTNVSLISLILSIMNNQEYILKSEVRKMMESHQEKLMWLDSWLISMLLSELENLSWVNPVEIIEEMIEEKQNSPWSCLNKYSKSQRKALQELLQKFNPSSTNQTSLR